MGVDFMNNAKKIRILFYKTPWKLKPKYFFNWLISLRTWSKYSHIEIWTPDSMGFGTLEDASGTCYTSTMRGKDNGTVSRDASGVLDHPENWDYIEIELTAGQYGLLLALMTTEVECNMGYSKWDIMKFISLIHIADNDRNICSEFVNNMLVLIGFIKGYGIVSPEAVHKKLNKLGLKTKELKGK